MSAADDDHHDGDPSHADGTEAPRAFFGRRKGHKLRPHQADLIDNLLPHLALDIQAPRPDPSSLFEPATTELRLEIGFGGGEHLVAEARAHGDLSENAEYDAAKERQAFIEARLAELKGKLADARIIDTAGRVSETVVFGATVVLIEQEAQEKKQYTLVGQDEADLKFSRISVQSPVGRALIGKRVGDLVEVTTPAKVVEYEVMEIRFEEL